ncbi:MAG: PBP1A family penicillin-binding protein [Bacteroidota bacterium]|nr:PBP1A family penicillin-binding protein [Bacteroidota bacterium]
MADNSKKKPLYSSEEMKKYFHDPSYRQEILKRSKGFFKKNRWYFYGAGVLFIILLVVYANYVISGLPSLEDLENPKPELATKVYSIDGETLGTFFLTKNRSYVTYNQIPQNAVDALISTEDKNFYKHWGVTPWRFLRAMVKNLLTFRLREGASTITQQLARNLYGFQGTNENAFDKATRKIREFFTSVQIEKNFTKKEILEMYLNTVYFGRGAYGISAAAGIFFGKSVEELTPGESAMLIAIVNGPAYFDPMRHPNRAMGRWHLVINQMLEDGRITQDQADKMKNEALTFSTNEVEGPLGLAPDFVEYIRQQMREKADKYGFNIYKDGLTVYTTLDSRMQRYANRAVEEHLAEKQAEFNKIWDWNAKPGLLAKVIEKAAVQSIEYQHATNKDSVINFLKKNSRFIDSVKQVWQSIQVGFVAIDPKSGGIRAMVGGKNFRSVRYGLNHVTQIRRQPGSCFKPFVYTVAIDNGYPPTYEMLNQPVTVELGDGTRWTPQNFEGDIGGKYTLRDALAQSINLVAVRTIMEIAPKEQVVKYAHEMGIKSPIPVVESIALGTAMVTPLEMTSAFGVFPNEGVAVEPNSILKIEDKDGNVIEENVPERREVLSKETAYIMTNMMEDVVNVGSGTRIRNYFHYPAAGKTGTTQGFADAWFVGFTPQLAAGAWVGFDDQAVTFNSADGQGGRAAAPLWGRFMKYVYEDKTIPVTQPYFKMPNGVERDSICVLTHKLATQFCPIKRIEVFNSKYLAPKCDVHTSADSTNVGSPSQF